jgi:hypothetical protein
MEGQGRFILRGGSHVLEYQGPFKNNQRHGVGHLLLADGTSVTAEFQENRLMRIF